MHPELAKGVDARQILGDRRRVLETIDNTEAPATFGGGNVGAASHQQQKIRVCGDLRIPMSDVADGDVVVLLVTADTAHRHIDRRQTRGLHIAKSLSTERRIRFGVRIARTA